MSVTTQATPTGMLLDTVDTLCTRVISPRAAEVDKDDVFPRDIYEAMAQAGLFGVWVPENYGGFDVGLRARMYIVERLARSHAASALAFANCGDAVSPIVQGGSDEQKQRWLPQIASGTAIPAFALTEPDAGSDVTAIATKATKRPDGYLISGQKVFITNGSVADVIVVFARTGSERSNISAFLVPAATPGLVIAGDEAMVGLHGCPTTALSFQDMLLPHDSLLGTEGKGLELAFHSIDNARLNVSAMALGAARAGFEVAVEYGGDRVQFGRSLLDHDGYTFMLAEVASEIYSAWATLERACDAIDGGGDSSTGVQAAMTKLICTGVGMRAATVAVQALGGYGLSTDYEVERIFRDVKAFEIFDGTNQIQKVIIGKYLKRVGVPPLTTV